MANLLLLDGCSVHPESSTSCEAPRYVGISALLGGILLVKTAALVYGR
jgi:hypothetical protein